MALSVAVQSIAGSPAMPPRPKGGMLVVDDDYPAEALRLRQEGTTRVELAVTRNGRLSGCRVATSSGSPALDREACRAMARWSFEPARDARGRTVAGVYATNFIWKLPAR